jgi:hypothetical protein
MEGWDYLPVNAELRAKGCLAAAGFTAKTKPPKSPSFKEGLFKPPVNKGG